MNVTIYSDASLCPQTKVVGWAIWIKSDRGTRRAEGVLKVGLLDTTIAEAMAAVNAIVIGVRNSWIHPKDIVVINTDNNAVMSILEGIARRKFKAQNVRRRGITFKQLKAEVKEANNHIVTVSDVYKDTTNKHDLSIRWQHVKGHRGTIDRRAAVNHNCDRRAKEQMSQAREKILKKRRRKNRRLNKNLQLPAKVLI